MPDRSRGLGSRWGPAAPRDPAGRKPARLSFLTQICHWHLPLAEPSWNPEARKPVSICPLGQRNRVGNEGGWTWLGR